MTLSRGTALFSVLALSAAAHAQDSGFWLPGLPAGANNSAVFGLSQDGSAAVGYSGGGPGLPGYTWTRQGGRIDFGLLPGMPLVSVSWGVSSSGSVLVGDLALTGGTPMPTHAYRWTGSGPLQDLGVLPGHIRSHARGVSGDGQSVAGWCEYSPFENRAGQAFLWTQTGGMQGLGFTRPGGTISEAYGISRDGSTVVGWSQNGMFGPLDAFVWTREQGMRALPQLPGAPFEASYAYAVNADGSTVVGSSPLGSSYYAVRWTSAGVQDLGLGTGFRNTFARATSDDGNVVGGLATDAANTSHASIWTPATGMVLLSDYLQAHGVGIPTGYRLEEVLAISGDGLSFAGAARNLASNHAAGFVATIPAPSSILVLALPALARRRRALI